MAVGMDTFSGVHVFNLSFLLFFGLLPTPAWSACACLYEAAGEIPAAAAQDAGNKKYGTSCSTKWDSLPDTKYYKNDTICPSDKKCTEGCNFLNLEWCYINNTDPECADVVSYPTTLAGGVDLAYSYDMCNNPRCWKDFYPWDAECPGGDGCKDCECVYETTGEIPAAAAADAGNKKYGTSCSTKWDSLPDTKYYKNDTTCPSDKKCTEGCNYLNLEWCYVNRLCKSHKSYPTTLAGGVDLAYSYDMCNNPRCWKDFYPWDAECPGGDGCKDCKCEYEAAGEIPAAAAADAGNKKYGTSCSTKWDSLPDTKYYKDDTTCPSDKKCTEGCNYLNLEWCYVNRFCKSHKSYPTTLAGGVDLAYSYDMCNNPRCWKDFYPWDAECPGGEECVNPDTTEAGVSGVVASSLVHPVFGGLGAASLIWGMFA